MSTVAERLAEVRERIREAAEAAGRDPASVRLVAVSKTHPPEAIREAYAAGQRDFGENYAQELASKAEALKDLPDVRFRFIGGLQKNKAKLQLGQVDTLRHDVASLDDAQVMRRLGAPGELPEGRFLPETYAYVKGDSDLDILERAHEAMTRTLAELWPGRDANLPLASPYDALILASIVEKETGRADERAQIAGVFVRRLQNHMLLQTDPSVIYGMGQAYAGNIHKSDLTADTPYNTYLRPGLPPTPIALPGRPAIEAALHPAPGDALYFVARGDGSHVFASSLAEHNRNVACYQLKRCHD